MSKPLGLASAFSTAESNRLANSGANFEFSLRALDRVLLISRGSIG